MIRIIIVIFFTLFLSKNPCYAQFTINLSKGMTFHLQESVEFDGAEIDITMPSQFAHNYVTELVEMTGLPMTFKLVQTNSEFLDHALAYLDGDDQYLIYNENFIKQVRANSHGDWTPLFILVHEIGHLLIKHPYSEDQKEKKKYELQADYFAGFWLNKLGATIQEAIQYAEQLPRQSKGYHPSRENRIKAISEGWNKANKKSQNISNTPCQTNMGSATFVNETNTPFVLIIRKGNYSNKIEVSISPGTSQTIDLKESDNMHKYSAHEKENGFYRMAPSFTGTISVIPCKTQVVILK